MNDLYKYNLMSKDEVKEKINEIFDSYSKKNHKTETKAELEILFEKNKNQAELKEIMLSMADVVIGQYEKAIEDLLKNHNSK